MKRKESAPEDGRGNRPRHGNMNGVNMNGGANVPVLIPSDDSQAEHDRKAVDQVIHYQAPSSAVLPSTHGTGPSGTMMIRITRERPCPGFPSSNGTIRLCFRMPSGIQAPYHGNPGLAYHGAHREAFLPNTPHGRQTLTRFRCAFGLGHMFRVGLSLATGIANTTTWNPGLRLKSSLYGGPFGFPDDQYLTQVNRQMDQIGILSAEACLTTFPPCVAQQVNVTPTVLPPSAASLDLSSILAVSGNNPTDNGHSRNIARQSSSRPSINAGDNSNPILVGEDATDQEYPVTQTTLTYTAPDTLAPSSTQEALEDYQPIATQGEECAICLDSLANGNPAARIVVCQHAFHRQCLTDALQHCTKCPKCRTPACNIVQGKCPSGTLRIAISAQACRGYSATTSISLSYNMPGGRQKTYHENPGERFRGAHRVAYLPNTRDGRKLLKRLEYAWTHGLTFRVGTSLTTGMPNQITWASIHHKTRTGGGAHGFPDPGYFYNCNEALDALHVPPAEDLR